MIPRPVAYLAAGLVAWTLAGAPPAVAQLYPPLPARYALSPGARDIRAAWVNPAGLALDREASIGADATVDRTTEHLRVAQYGASLQSANLAFAWSHSRYPGGLGANAYVLAIGLGDEALSAGVARRWFRGGRNTGAWDLALRARASASADLSLVWRMIGSPWVRDSVLRRWPAGIVPGAGLRLLGGRLQAAAETELRTDLGGVREVRFGATVMPLRSLSITVRGDLSPGFSRRGFAVAVTWWQAGSRVAVASIMPSSGVSVDAIGASGSIVAIPPGRGSR